MPSALSFIADWCKARNLQYSCRFADLACDVYVDVETSKHVIKTNVFSQLYENVNVQFMFERSCACRKLTQRCRECTATSESNLHEHIWALLVSDRSSLSHGFGITLCYKRRLPQSTDFSELVVDFENWEKGFGLRTTVARNKGDIVCKQKGFVAKTQDKVFSELVDFAQTRSRVPCA